MKDDAAVVDVATKLGAVTVLYAVTVPRKSELPVTSNILPVVVVALLPKISTLVVSAGCIAKESDVVENAPAPPEPCRSVDHTGTPPTNLSTWPLTPTDRAESVSTADAYKMSPTASELGVSSRLRKLDTPLIPRVDVATKS